MGLRATPHFFGVVKQNNYSEEEDVMKFTDVEPSYGEFEEGCSDLEITIELEIPIFEAEPDKCLVDEMPDHYIFQDDYMQKELERQQEDEQQLLPDMPLRIP